MIDFKCVNVKFSVREIVRIVDALDRASELHHDIVRDLETILAEYLRERQLAFEQLQEHTLLQSEIEMVRRGESICAIREVRNRLGVTLKKAAELVHRERDRQEMVSVRLPSEEMLAGAHPVAECFDDLSYDAPDPSDDIPF